ncbi:MAG: PaaI family thioesterase [Gammaproteobacteria bacterium]
MSDAPKKMSALQMAAAMGDRLPLMDDLPQGALDLAEATRDFVAAVVATDLDDASRREMAERIRAFTVRLRERQRDPLIVLTRTREGWIENFTQAGWGRWNPQSLRIRFDPAQMRFPEPGALPQAVEITATCTLTEAHSGPPQRAHGGVVMTLLDEALGVAAAVAGAGGMTAGMNVRFKAATPLGVPLTLRSRYERSEGRKRFVSGEVIAGDVTTAQAEGIFIAPAQDG